MKKRMLLLLSGLVLCLSLSACGDADKDYDDDDDEYEEETKSKKKKEAKTDVESTVDELIESVDGAQATVSEEKKDVEEVKEEVKPAKELSAQSLAGIWVTDKIDATDVFMQGFMSTGAEYADYFQIDKFEIALRLDMKEDGSYVMSMDPDALQDAVGSLSVAMKEGMGRYLEDSFRELAEQNGMSYDKLLEAYGVADVSELMIKSTGQSLDELVDSLFEDLTDQLDDSMNESGQYTIDGNNIMLVINGTEEICHYDSAKDTFVIEDNGNRGESAFLFPMTFHRK